MDKKKISAPLTMKTSSNTQKYGYTVIQVNNIEMKKFMLSVLGGT